MSYRLALRHQDGRTTKLHGEYDCLVTCRAEAVLLLTITVSEYVEVRRLDTGECLWVLAKGRTVRDPDIWYQTPPGYQLEWIDDE